MMWSAVLVGVLIAIISLFKQITKISVGYQLINVPGYVIVVMGIVITILGSIA